MKALGIARRAFEDVEAAPSRFSNSGEDYAAWAARADKWILENTNSKEQKHGKYHS